ncbi:MAG: glycosyltransferase [Rhizonema sp. PD38]|nr:glycosyltransferase [Rhizonema sp. PD38]
MQIFLCCQQALKKHNVPAYSFWESYFKQGIQEAGYQWLEAEGVDWAEGLVYMDREALNEWRKLTWNQVISSIKKLQKTRQVDLFLSYLFPKQVDINTVQEIKSLGIPCVNFFCDNVREFIRVPKEFYCFDLHWVPEYKALKMYEQAGLLYTYAPMPVWIAPHQRTCKHLENYGVSFIGSRDVQREMLLAQVIKSDVAVDIRGSGWRNDVSTSCSYKYQNQSLWQTSVNQVDMIATQGILPWVRKIQTKFLPKISNDILSNFVKETPNAVEYVTIIQQSMVCLGVNRYPSYHYPFFQPDTYSRMRDIEAPMMGACYLTEWTEGLDCLYELGEEIETYCTAEEMIEKIRSLQADPEKRRRMRCKVQKRALEEHTVAKSLKRITKTLGLS